MDDESMVDTRLMDNDPVVAMGTTEATARAALRSKEECAQYVSRFWTEQYLETFIAQGGSKIKFLTGAAESGKSACLRHYLSDAAASGYKTTFISGKGTWLHDFRDIYAAIFSSIDFEGCMRACANQVIEAMGYDQSDIPEGMRFVDFLQMTGSLDPLTKREIRAQLSRLFFENRNIDSNFAIASALITSGYLGYPALESESEEQLLRWLWGDKGVRVASLRRLGLSPSRITRQNARHMLYSLLEVVRLAGFAGIAVAVDNLEMLAETSVLEEIRYTKMRREDAYESIRELIDGIDALGYFIIVFAMDASLLEDETRGLKSYQALWMRIQNEISSSRVNRFADIIDLNKVARQLEGAEHE
ncbi:MAG: ATP-binding protein [Coriobacteriales bacterium]|jgi:hypothetical protein|nr:ATP-binding protein [Coriobacteriales bacterium]